jgi:hypothetical protein
VQIKAVEASQSTGHRQVDAIEFVMSDLLQTSLAFAYFHAESQVPQGSSSSVQAAAVAAAFWIGLRMFVILEFVDHNGVPGFQLNTTDEITGYYDLSNAALQWKPITFEKTDLTDSNGQTFSVHAITMETADEVFLLSFVVTERPVTVDGNRVNCDSVKVDFQIKWFNNPLHRAANWTTGESNSTAYPNAQVAIFAATAAIAGAAAAVAGDTNKDPQFQIAAGAYTGLFSWKPNADVVVQGATAARAVFAHVVDTSKNPDIQAAFAAGWVVRILLFSFEGNRPSSVYWDPIFGANLDYKQLDSAAGTNSVHLVLLLLALLFSMLFVKH